MNLPIFYLTQDIANLFILDGIDIAQLQESDLIKLLPSQTFNQILYLSNRYDERNLLLRRLGFKLNTKDLETSYSKKVSFKDINNPEFTHILYGERDDILINADASHNRLLIWEVDFNNNPDNLQKNLEAIVLTYQKWLGISESLNTDQFKLLLKVSNSLFNQPATNGQ